MSNRPAFGTDPPFLVLGLLLAVSGLACATYSQLLSERVDHRHQVLRQVNQEISELQTRSRQRQERRLEALRWQGLQSDLREPLRYAALLREVARRTPENFWLTHLDIDPSSATVQLQGKVASQPGHPPLATVSRFVGALDQSGLFSRTSLRSISRGQDQDGPSTFRVELSAPYDPQVAQAWGARLAAEGRRP